MNSEGTWTAGYRSRDGHGRDFPAGTRVEAMLWLLDEIDQWAMTLSALRAMPDVPAGRGEPAEADRDELVEDLADAYRFFAALPLDEGGVLEVGAYTYRLTRIVTRADSVKEVLAGAQERLRYPAQRDDRERLAARLETLQAAIR